jgi:hypothetical protein
VISSNNLKDSHVNDIASIAFQVISLVAMTGFLAHQWWTRDINEYILAARPFQTACGRNGIRLITGIISTLFIIAVFSRMGLNYLAMGYLLIMTVNWLLMWGLYRRGLQLKQKADHTREQRLAAATSSKPAQRKIHLVA